MLQLLNGPKNGQYVHLVTGLYHSCLFDGIPDIQSLSSIDVHAHMHMVYGGFHRHHYLVLDQNASDNIFSTPLCHEVWNVDHKMVMQVIYFCYNTFSHLCLQHQHYLEHDTVCLSIFYSHMQIHTGNQNDDVSLANELQHHMTKEH